MAGLVYTDTFHIEGGRIIDQVARQCPITEKYGEVCQRYDPHIGSVQICPYWLGLEILDEGNRQGQARSISEAVAWMATHEWPTLRTYRVLCSEAEPNIQPGAARSR